MSGLRLSELAQTSGVSRHTIRSYISRQLLPGPRTRGRNARYSQEHLERLQAIRVLREERGLGLDAIRLLLATLTEPEIRAVASRQPPALADISPGTRPTAGGSALAYLEVLRGAAPPAAAQAEPPSAGATLPTPPLLSSPASTLADTLVQRLRGAGEVLKAPRQARAEPWVRITITPDVELLVRGTQDQTHIRQLERLADHLRHILRGGTYEEKEPEPQHSN